MKQFDIFSEVNFRHYSKILERYRIASDNGNLPPSVAIPGRKARETCCFEPPRNSSTWVHFPVKVEL